MNFVHFVCVGPQIKSRTGHSMLFNTADRNLYIFGGQRKVKKKYIENLKKKHEFYKELEIVCWLLREKKIKITNKVKTKS